MRSSTRPLFMTRKWSRFLPPRSGMSASAPSFRRARAADHEERSTATISGVRSSESSTFRSAPCRPEQVIRSDQQSTPGGQQVGPLQMTAGHQSGLSSTYIVKKNFILGVNFTIFQRSLIFLFFILAVSSPCIDIPYLGRYRFLRFPKFSTDTVTELDTNDGHCP